MLEQIALANVIGKILNLPASAAEGPGAAEVRGLTALANPRALPLWQIAEKIAPNGTLRDVFVRLYKDLGSVGSAEALMGSGLPYKSMLLGMLPSGVRDSVEFGVTEYIRDPKALSDYIEDNLDVKRLADGAREVLATTKRPYRCAKCTMPFFSTQRAADISCPFCE